MATILLRVPVDAEPKVIYDALATSDGVKGWWSNHTEGPGGPGSTMKVAFPDAPITFDFEVTAEEPGKRVAWRCLAGPPEWIGTAIRFDVQSGADGSTSVLFAHDGWGTTEESFPFIAYSWAQILPRLKKLAETGEADPYFRF
ncbi:MAG TPA: SRPBCC domain-containing protein [Actinomycetota bacterium]|nr:SRPBCC domain-containing protein [Actinomycetota bacterium]